MILNLKRCKVSGSWGRKVLLGLILIQALALPYPILHAESFPNTISLSGNSSAMKRVMLRGLQISPQNPWEMKFILDGELNNGIIKEQGDFAVRLFLAALSMNQDDLWVNLSVYEQGRVMVPLLRETDLGKVFMQQDLMLKKVIGRLTDPNLEQGRKYWREIYQLIEKKFGRRDMNLSLYHKVWIVPETVQMSVWQHTGVITKSRLKVLTDNDYLAKWKEQDTLKNNNAPWDQIPLQVFKQKIIPQLDELINEGKEFEPLRQAFRAIILATWYKDRFKSQHMVRALGNKNLVNGFEVMNEETLKKYFTTYQRLYAKGQYQVIDEIKTDSGMKEVRKYASGGLQFKLNIKEKPLNSPNDIQKAMLSKVSSFIVRFKPLWATVAAITMMSVSGQAEDLGAQKEVAIKRLAQIEQRLKRDFMSIKAGELSQYQMEIKSLRKKIRETEAQLLPDKIHRKEVSILPSTIQKESILKVDEKLRTKELDNNENLWSINQEGMKNTDDGSPKPENNKKAMKQNTEINQGTRIDNNQSHIKDDGSKPEIEKDIIKRDRSEGEFIRANQNPNVTPEVALKVEEVLDQHQDITNNFKGQLTEEDIKLFSQESTAQPIPNFSNPDLKGTPLLKSVDLESKKKAELKEIKENSRGDDIWAQSTEPPKRKWGVSLDARGGMRLDSQDNRLAQGSVDAMMDYRLLSNGLSLMANVHTQMDNETDEMGTSEVMGKEVEEKNRHAWGDEIFLGLHQRFGENTLFALSSLRGEVDMGWRHAPKYYYGVSYDGGLALNLNGQDIGGLADAYVSWKPFEKIMPQGAFKDMYLSLYLNVLRHQDRWGQGGEIALIKGPWRWVAGLNPQRDWEMMERAMHLEHLPMDVWLGFRYQFHPAWQMEMSIDPRDWQTFYFGLNWSFNSRKDTKSGFAPRIHEMPFDPFKWVDLARPDRGMLSLSRREFLLYLWGIALNSSMPLQGQGLNNKEVKSWPMSEVKATPNDPVCGVPTTILELGATINEQHGIYIAFLIWYLTEYAKEGLDFDPQSDAIEVQSALIKQMAKLKGGVDSLSKEEAVAIIKQMRLFLLNRSPLFWNDFIEQRKLSLEHIVLVHLVQLKLLAQAKRDGIDNFIPHDGQFLSDPFTTVMNKTINLMQKKKILFLQVDMQKQWAKQVIDLVGDFLTVEEAIYWAKALKMNSSLLEAEIRKDFKKWLGYNPRLGMRLAKAKLDSLFPSKGNQDQGLDDALLWKKIQRATQILKSTKQDQAMQGGIDLRRWSVGENTKSVNITESQGPNVNEGLRLASISFQIRQWENGFNIPSY